MNFYTKYLSAVRLIKGLMVLDKLYKWLFWIALICSCVYYVFSLSKEFMWHLVIITGSIAIIWVIIRMLRLHKMHRLSGIYNLSMKNQNFREMIMNLYRKRLKKIDHKLQKKSSKILEAKREDLLYLIEGCISYDSKNTNYEQYKFIPYLAEILKEDTLCIIEYGINHRLTIGKIIEVDKENDYVSISYLCKNNEFVEKHFYDLQTGIRNTSCKIIAIELVN